jgi:hypothetical protein
LCSFDSSPTQKGKDKRQKTKDFLLQSNSFLAMSLSLSLFPNFTTTPIIGPEFGPYFGPEFCLLLTLAPEIAIPASERHTQTQRERERERERETERDNKNTKDSSP